MKLRTLLTTSIFLINAMAMTACVAGTSADYESDPAEADFVEAPSNSASNCVSNMPSVSDAWCQAVACAPTYVDGGFCKLAGGEEETKEEAKPVSETPAPPVVEEPAEDAPEQTKSDNSGDCVSNQAGISDAWCQAVKCAPVYIDQGFCKLGDTSGVREPAKEPKAEKETSPEPPVVTDEANPYYPNWGAGTCVSDGEQPSWQTALYANPADCCEKHFSWKLDDCLNDTGANADTTEVPEVADEDNTPVEEEDNDEEDNTPVEEEDNDEEDNTTALAPNTCPNGWTKKAKDCSGLPWQNSVRWHCTQTLPSAATQSCTSNNVDLTDETCVVSSGNMAATWCVNPNPTAKLVCGDKVCSVSKSGNECKAIPMGGNSFFFACP